MYSLSAVRTLQQPLLGSLVGRRLTQKNELYLPMHELDTKCSTPCVLQLINTDQQGPCSFTKGVCDSHRLLQKQGGNKIHPYLDHLLQAGKIFSLLECANKVSSWLLFLLETPKYTRLFSTAFCGIVFRLGRNPSDCKGSQLCLHVKLHFLVSQWLLMKVWVLCTTGRTLWGWQSGVAVYPEQGGQYWHPWVLFRKGACSDIFRTCD